MAVLRITQAEMPPPYGKTYKQIQIHYGHFGNLHRQARRQARPFSLEKIKRAISKAFLSVGGYATDDDLTSVLSRVHISDGMNVEEIQNQVEVALMAERYFAVAKSYMLYRQKHTEDREDRENSNS